MANSPSNRSGKKQGNTVGAQQSRKRTTNSVPTQSQQATPASNSSQSDAHWKLDVVRGVLIVCFVLLHLVDTLWPSSLVAFWPLLSFIGSSVFLVTVGMSVSLLYRAQGSFPRHVLSVAFRLLLIALAVSMISYYYSPTNVITFGILHVIALSLVLCIFVVARPLMALLIGIAFFIEGLILSISPTLPTALGWIGPSPFLLDGFEYYPLLPWAGLIFIGIYLSHRLYPNIENMTVAPTTARPFIWCSKYVLVLYLLTPVVTLLLLHVI